MDVVASQVDGSQHSTNHAPLLHHTTQFVKFSGLQVLTSAGVAASDESAVASEDGLSAPGSTMEAQLTAAPSTRRSVAELQKALLANPVAGPPLGKVGQLNPAAIATLY